MFRLRRLRWYWIVTGVLLLLVNGLPAVEMLLSSVSWASALAEMGYRLGSSVPALLAYLALFGGFVVWACWVCPWLDAGDLTPHWRVEPAQRLRNLRALIWLPAALVLLTSATLVFGQSAQVYLARQTWHWRWGFTERWGAWVFILGAPPTAGLCAWITRRVTRRFHNTTHARRLCFVCGYDLRASPGPACPECGATATGEM